jgi:hypothetical protein
MFYARINKIKVFDNREGFLGLFNRHAKMRIYSYIKVNMSPAKKRMLPRLLDVPEFSGILIHCGNTKNDSSGCILIGENKVKRQIINSMQYEKRLVEILSEAQDEAKKS